MKPMLRTILRITLFGAFALVVWRVLIELNWAELLAHPLLLLSVIGFQLVNVLVQFFMWHKLVSTNDFRLSFASAYRLYGSSMMSRYLPAGKIAQLAPLVLLADNDETRAKSISATLVLVASGILSGVMLVILGYHWISPQTSMIPIVSVGAGVLAAFTFFPIERTVAVLRKLLRKFRPHRPEAWSLFSSDVLSRRNMAWATLGSLGLCWLPEVASAMCLLEILKSSVSFSDAAYFTVAYALASFSGALAFFVPGALGVREGALVVITSGRLRTFESAFIALGLRGALTMAEIVFFLPLIWQNARGSSKIAQSSGLPEF